MTTQKRRQRAAFIGEQPLFWFLQPYATALLACAVGIDVLRLLGAGGPSRPMPYLLPVAVALPLWLGLRSWARRVEVEAESADG
jgi:hypothetical protein